MVKHSDESRSRILDGIKKYSRIVGQARHRGMNERDTADVVKAMLGDMLGYDPFFDVTADISVRGPLADYAVQVDGKLQFLLLVNPIGAIPSSAQLLRLSGAAAPPYADWLLLTNGDIWSCYRLGVGADRHAEVVFRVSLLDASPQDEKESLFYLLSKESVVRNDHNRYWEHAHVMNASRIARMILTEESLSLLRREIMRKSNYRVDRNTLYDILVREVIRPEALASSAKDTSMDARRPHCFAYVRDPNDPSSWRLQYRNPDGTPDADLLMIAVVDVSSEGRISGVPADDLPLVKQRLRNAYLELGVTLNDLPSSLQI